MTPIAQQIQTMESLAARHYPDDEGQRNAFLVRMLSERLMAFYTTYVETSYSELRRAGFTPEEIALGSQEVVRS